MEPEILTLVRIPLTEVVGHLRTEHHLNYDYTQMTVARVEDDMLVLEFAVRSPVSIVAGEATTAPKTARTAPAVEVSTEHVPKRSVAKRKSTKRRRMKTRGWKVVARIVNSSGQKAAVYEPFVAALSQADLSKAQKESVVRKILKDNGNNPTDASVQYYLQNTLDYLRQTDGRPA